MTPKIYKVPGITQWLSKQFKKFICVCVCTHMYIGVHRREGCWYPTPSLCTSFLWDLSQMKPGARPMAAGAGCSPLSTPHNTGVTGTFTEGDLAFYVGSVI